MSGCIWSLLFGLRCENAQQPEQKSGHPSPERHGCPGFFSLPVDIAAERLATYFKAAVEPMEVMARATGHRHLSDFKIDDLTTFKKDMAELTGVAYGGVT